MPLTIHSGGTRMAAAEKKAKAAVEKKPARKVKNSRSAVQLVFDNDDIGTRLAKDRKFVWALARGLEILRAFSARPAPLGNSELATITNLPKATISRLTHT